MPTGIVGLGAFAPPDVIDNAQITAWTGATEEWVAERTGIHNRRYAAPGVTTSELAAQAVLNLFTDSPHTLEDVGLSVLATSTPDQPQPSTAVRMHNLLRIRNTAPAFDVNAVCAGFVYALSVADAMLSRDRGSGTALVVGVDVYSTIMDRSDRRTVALFGDAAGAPGRAISARPAGTGTMTAMARRSRRTPGPTGPTRSTGSTGPASPRLCPCGLPTAYGECCGRFHSGAGVAPTAEVLMRSRYCAFLRQDEAYLLRTWHPRTRPARVDFDAGMRWTGLEILGSEQGSAFHATGTVTFRASYRGGSLHERSRFERVDGAWVYVDGEFLD